MLLLPPNAQSTLHLAGATAVVAILLNKMSELQVREYLVLEPGLQLVEEGEPRSTLCPTFLEAPVVQVLERERAQPTPPPSV